MKFSRAQAPPNPRRRRAHHSKAQRRRAWSTGTWELHRAFAASVVERITYAIYVGLSSDMFTQCSILAPPKKGPKHQLAAQVTHLPAPVSARVDIKSRWRGDIGDAPQTAQRVLGVAVQRLPSQERWCWREPRNAAADGEHR